MERKSAIKLALGEELPELVLKHAKVVNVFTREIEEADVAISDGMICGQLLREELGGAWRRISGPWLHQRSLSCRKLNGHPA